MNINTTFFCLLGSCSIHLCGGRNRFTTRESKSNLQFSKAIEYVEDMKQQEPGKNNPSI